MADKVKARSLVKEFFSSIGKEPLLDHDAFLAKLASMPDDEFQALPFPAKELLDGCFYMGCTEEEYVKTTTPGIPLELFSDFCHSFVYSCDASKEEIERGHNTFKNYTMVKKRPLASSDLCPKLPGGAGVEENFYIVWTIYQRKDGVSSDFGPEFFSILAMNGDVLGNYGVVFAYAKHKPFGLVMPSQGRSWSRETFRQCNHSQPTREVVRYQFVPRVMLLVNICFGNSVSRPDFLLTLKPYESLGVDDDDFGSAELYGSFMANFPTKVLEIPARLCRNGAEGNFTLYSGK